MEYTTKGEIEIDVVYLPITAEEDENCIKILELAYNNHIKISYLQTGNVFKEKNLKIACLHPAEDFKTESRNATSIVLHVQYKEFDLLLTGDLEKEGEEMLLRQGLIRRCEVLKVAHHGSEYSTSEAFLEKVQPSYAIISCGRENPYGHPHTNTLERLKRIHCQVYITKKSGEIIISNGKKIKIHTFVERKRKCIGKK